MMHYTCSLSVSKDLVGIKIPLSIIITGFIRNSLDIDIWTFCFERHMKCSLYRLSAHTSPSSCCDLGSRLLIYLQVHQPNITWPFYVISPLHQEAKRFIPWAEAEIVLMIYTLIMHTNCTATVISLSVC